MVGRRCDGAWVWWVVSGTAVSYRVGTVRSRYDRATVSWGMGTATRDYEGTSVWGDISMKRRGYGGA